MQFTQTKLKGSFIIDLDESRSSGLFARTFCGGMCRAWSQTKCYAV